MALAVSTKLLADFFAKGVFAAATKACQFMLLIVLPPPANKQSCPTSDSQGTDSLLKPLNPHLLSTVLKI
ncbi:hypothetical protein PSPTOT1_1096 [Pseudomonas syringae pv. tomato T1]|nr:hypothetical protein PSPTOT1_1096 [Pseudomonas syringae pv. tomato T1]